MAFFANYPFVLAPGMGLNAYFAFTICAQKGYSWHVALAAVFVEGIIFIILSAVNVREAIFNAIPANMKKAVSVGIGMFIAFIGLQNAGVVINNPSTCVSLGDVKTVPVALALIGTIITLVLVIRKVKGALLVGILITWILGIICQLAGVYVVDVEAGVYSLKIEGRMKKPEYTAGVVSVYRKYLDKYLSGEKRPVVTKEDKQMLWDIYNRDGFHQSYYKQRNGRSMMALENEKSAGIIRNEELFTRIRKEYMDKKTPVLIRGAMSLYNGCPAILEVQAGDCRVTVEGETVQTAMNCPLGEERIRRQMEKTGGSGFMFEKLDIFMGDDIFLPMQQLNHLRRQGLEALEEEMLRPWKQRKAKERDLKDIPETEKQTTKEFLTAAVETEEQLAAVEKTDGVKRIYADCGIFPVSGFVQNVERWIHRLEEEGKELFLTLPRIVRDRELDGRKETFQELVQKGLGGFLVRNMESYGILDAMGLTSRIVLDANIYTMNNRAEAFWMKKGILGDTVPLELNAKELVHRNNKNSELTVYGYTPMMVSVQCVQKTMDHCNHACVQYVLKDRYQKEFRGVCSCEFCYNTIYNTLPTSLLKEKEKAEKLGVKAYRLSFTIETQQETEKIVRAFVDVYLRGQKPDGQMQTEETTKGHFQRGVE